MAASIVVSSVDHRRYEMSQFGGRHRKGTCPFPIGALGVDRAVAQRKFRARGIAQVHCSHISCVRRVGPAAFSKVSAPESALASTNGRLPRCPFAEDDPAFAQIVWRHFDVYAVSNDRSDAIATHLSCSVADKTMPIVEGDAEAPVGQDLVDRALHRNELFFRQSSHPCVRKIIRTDEFRSGAGRMKWKWCRCRA